MEENDKRILQKLLEDGRATLSEIGDTVDLTRQTVKRRIEGLKKGKIIKKFSAEVSEERLGLRERAYIILKAKPDSDLRERFSEELKSIPEVSQFHYLFGRFDGIIEIIAANESKLHEIIEGIHQFDVVEDTETIIVHKTIKKDHTDPILKHLEEN